MTGTKRKTRTSPEEDDADAETSEEAAADGKKAEPAEAEGKDKGDGKPR